MKQSIENKKEYRTPDININQIWKWWKLDGWDENKISLRNCGLDASIDNVLSLLKIQSHVVWAINILWPIIEYR